MLSPAHFVDTPFGGSAHGVVQGGLTALGRELLVARRGQRDGVRRRARVVGDDRRHPVAGGPPRGRVAHRCPRRRPQRPQSPRRPGPGIAATGGLVGIGFWPVACGGDDAAAIARSIVTAIELAGIEHVGLGSDFDGAVATPFDATGMALLTEALLAEGLSDDESRPSWAERDRVLGASLPSVTAARDIGQTRAAMSAAARAAPSRLDGSIGDGRSISAAIASAITSGGDAS